MNTKQPALQCALTTLTTSNCLSKIFDIENEQAASLRNISGLFNLIFCIYFNNNKYSDVLQEYQHAQDAFRKAKQWRSVGSWYVLDDSGHKPPAMADTPAGRYAGSLFTAASKSEALQTVLGDLTELSKLINAEPVIRQFFQNSSVKRTQHREIVHSFARDEYCQITNNFLDTVIDSGRMSDLEKIIETYVTYCKILNKEEDIRIISASELSSEDKERVVAAYKKSKPDVTFKITYEVDPAILGGLQIYAGSEFLDCSLRSRLTTLKTELSRIA